MQRIDSKKRRRILRVVLLLLIAGLLVFGGLAVRQTHLNSALFQAIERSDLPAVQENLDAGADPNARKSELFTPYFFRQWFHKPGHDPRLTPLRAALDRAVVNIPVGFDPSRAESPEEKIVLRLLEHHADPNFKDDRQNALEMMIAGRYNRCVQALALHGADPKRAFLHNHLLATAINCQNSPETIAALIHSGATVQGEAGGQALWAAYGKILLGGANRTEGLAIMQMLLDAGADPNSRINSNIGSPLLYSAVSSHQQEIVQMLAKAHADPNIPVKGEPPLLYRALDCTPKIFQTLLADGADANIRQDNGEPLLWYALIHHIDEPLSDKTEKVRLLLEHGADIQQKFNTTSYGNVSVLEAAHRGAKEWNIEKPILDMLNRAAGRYAPYAAQK